MIKKLPFSKEKILEITKKYRTPFLIYDEKGIRENARRLKKAFKSGDQTLNAKVWNLVCFSLWYQGQRA